MPSLFDPLTLGALTLPNRIRMAPLTRARACRSHIANSLMAEHYAQRASAGLLIVEATMVAADGCAFTGEPGICDDACAAGWRGVTDAVHAAGGRMQLQIWHPGRSAHECVDAAVAEAGAGRVGLRLSPLAGSNDLVDSDPDALLAYVAVQFGARGIFYLELRHMNQALDEGSADAIVFDRACIANPDLVERLRPGAPLNEPEPKTYCAAGATGYTDYPRPAA